MNRRFRKKRREQKRLPRGINVRDGLPGCVEKPGVAVGIKHALPRLYRSVIARSIVIRYNSIFKRTGIQPVTDVPVGRDKTRIISCLRGTEITTVDNFRVGFKIICDNESRVFPGKTGDDPRSGEYVKKTNVLPVHSVQNFIESCADKRQQRPLVPQAGYELIGKKSGVFGDILVHTDMTIA